MGVENVFSYEFYDIVKSSLAEGGVLLQWAQLYSIDTESLQLIFHTLRKVFPYAKIYRIGRQDIAIVAGFRPLKKNISEERFFNSLLKPYHEALGFHQPEDLSLAQIFSEDIFSKISKSNQFGLHTLSAPKLAYKGDKTFFLGQVIAPENLFSGALLPPKNSQKAKALSKYEALSQQEIEKKCEKIISFLCPYIAVASSHNKRLENKQLSPSQKLNSYVYLRKRGFIEHKPQFLEDLKKEFVEKEIKHSPMIQLYLDHILSQGEYKKAQKDLEFLQSRQILTDKNIEDFKNYIQKVKKEQEKLNLGPY